MTDDELMVIVILEDQLDWQPWAPPLVGGTFKFTHIQKNAHLEAHMTRRYATSLIDAARVQRDHLRKMAKK
jgi:hypothetical protein